MAYNEVSPDINDEKTKVMDDSAKRIIYVEPNDVAYGRMNDIPVTPDYTDFCISFDLIVDVVSRMRANSGTIARDTSKSNDSAEEAMKTYVISWTSEYKPDRKPDEKVPNVVSFMSGERYGSRKYLTTYYTDIHYNDFKDKTIVEGLGVESVNISFETYYAPTVKIRFIDVRGASIFGREEVLHTDEVLAEDTVWGCFFTFPYPKYRLQVKGFYGKAVTFQLCCTDFRANFNPQTGNYEIDMSFLGYDFGLLADIPMQYLIAAPYCDYADTKAFWAKNASSNLEWRMSDGRAPETFYNIRYLINEIIEKGPQMDGGGNVSAEEIEGMAVDKDREELVGRIYALLSSMDAYEKEYANKVLLPEKETVNVPVLKNTVDYDFFDIGESTLEEDRDNGSFFSDIRDLRVEMKALYEEYKEKYPDSEVSKFEIKWVYENEGNPVTDTNIQETHFKKEYAAFREIVLKEYSDVRSGAIGPYKSQSKLTDDGKIWISKTIQEMVHILPNIGNVFLTLYCHLETFIHMIYRCTKNIYSQMGDRTVKKMGLPSISNVPDVPVGENGKETLIIPFPAVCTFEKMDDRYETVQAAENEEIPVDAWIGEVRNSSSPKWEEELLIENLFTAVLKVTKQESNDVLDFSSTSFPILPCDLNHENIPEIGLSEDPESLAAYLALRAAAIFGVAKFSADAATDIGKAEAFHYYESMSSKTGIKEKILNCMGDGQQANYLYNIALCNDGSTEPKYTESFEVATGLWRQRGTNKNKRQPFFVEKGGKLTYCYTESEAAKPNSFIPAHLQSWGSLSDENYGVLGYHGSASNSYYNFKTIANQSAVLHKRFVKSLVNDDSKFDPLLYQNHEVVRVYYGENGGKDYDDGSLVSAKVEEMYKSLKDGAVSLTDYTLDSNSSRFKSITDGHWITITDADVRENYFQRPISLYPPMEAWWDKTLDGWKVGETGYESLKAVKNEKFRNRHVIYNPTSKKLSFNGKDYSDDECNVWSANLFVKHAGGIGVMNVFTSKIYYYQNYTANLSGTPLKYGNSFTDMIDRAKAFLFLMSVNCPSNKSPKFLSNEGVAIIEELPLAKLLLYGAFCWRYRFFKLNGFDPIRFDYAKDTPGVDGSKYKHVPIDCVPMFEDNGLYVTGFIMKESNATYRKLKHLIPDSDQPQADFSLFNALIEAFYHFTSSKNGPKREDGEWQVIKSGCELVKSNGTPLTHIEFSELLNATDTTNLNEIIKTLNLSLETRYRFIGFPGKTGMTAVFREDNTALNSMRKLYTGRVVVQKTVPSFTNTDNGSVVSISKSTFTNFLNGFITQITDICNSEGSQKSVETTGEVINGDNDIKRLMYIFIKNLWDRWLCGNSEKTYTVENMMRNTIFMDSMYRNVYERIHVNCEILKNLLDESDGQAMVFKFMSDLTTKHHCMFFALPDYLNLGGPDSKTAHEGMRTLFTPMPYSKINEVSATNKYIVMFTHKPSEIAEDANSYKYDSFDIYSHDGDKNSILGTFQKDALDGVSSTEPHDIQLTRYGYNLPAFGVEFGRQNNSIFKRVNVGMQNPIQTEQAINALSLIAERGRGEGLRTIFYGQDLYSVYSGYSYLATLEMMGNAQIMPLMYFQLFNVPMFRGAYMIYGVTHTMRPGDMTTTVRAMKMSKRTLPWCQEWFAHYYFGPNGEVLKLSDDDDCSTISGDTPWMDFAYSELKKGAREEPKGSNRGKDVEKYMVNPGEAWCGRFVTWCMKQAAITNLPSSPGLAASWRTFGTKLEKPAYGAIAIEKDGHHVAFVCGQKNGRVIYLGGNQSDAVTKMYDDNMETFVFPKGYKPNYILPAEEITTNVYKTT